MEIIWYILLIMFIALDVIDTYQTIRAKEAGLGDVNKIVDILRDTMSVVVYSFVFLIFAVSLAIILKNTTVPILSHILLTGFIGLKIYLIIHNHKILKKIERLRFD